MSRLDDRLTTELERAARPADPAGVFERIDRRRTRHHAARRVRAGALAVVVIAGSIGGFAYLTRAFGPTRVPGGVDEASVRDGLIVFSALDEFGIGHLWSHDPTTGQERALIAGDTAALGSDGSPAVSPDGRTVAFVRTNGLGPAIYTVGIDGAGLKMIADAAAGPAWSPDGARLAFTRDGPRATGIWTMNPDGSDPILVPGTEALRTGDPAWSPDGSTLAFEAFGPGDGGKICDLFTVALDGPSDLRQLTNTPTLNETSPSWSPDGTRIVYSQMSSHPNVNKDGGIAVLTVLQGDVDFLTRGGSYDRNPAWSPSGASIAFDRSIEQQTVYTIKADGSQLTEIGGGVEPAWQPIHAEPGPTASTAPSPPSNPEQAGPGLGFPTCNVSSVTGTFGSPGVQGTAYVATKMGDTTGCPPVDDGFNVIAIDLDGDGIADADYGPIQCELECRVFSAPDLNGDGISELLVVQQGGTVPGLGVFAMRVNSGPEGVGPVPVETASPGDPGHGFVPDRPARLFVGGDAGDSAGLSCSTQGEVLLVQHLGSMVPFDSPDAVWKIHETTFTLGPDGRLHVVSTEDREAPLDQIPFGGSDPFHIEAGFPCAR